MIEAHEHANAMTNSHLLAQEFDYQEAATLDEALALLESHAGKARVLAGGTDLMVMMKMERARPGTVINISKIPGLGEVRANPDGSLSLGALVSIHTLATHPAVRARYPGLAEAAQSFGSTQIEMMGTVGGNLCNGSPAADTAPVLLALCADVILASKAGRRILPLEEFFRGPGKTALRQDELLVEVTIPAAQPGSTSVFLKAARVVADLAKASLAIAFTRDGEHIQACRVAMGSVAPVPVLLLKTAKALIGQDYAPELLAAAGKIAGEEISPIDDARSSAWYRRQIAGVLLQDAMALAWERAAERMGQRPALQSEMIAGKVGRRPAPQSGTARAEELREIELNVNGRAQRVFVKPNELLLNVLREKLQLTGSKYACGIGECSACTVQIDGQPMLSCLILAVSAAGKEIVTVEGLEQDGKLDLVQEAFIEHTAYQCGYCTPGILMTAKSLLGENPHPSEDEARQYLRGNHCRCTGYASIVRAVLGAAEKLG